MAPVVKNLPANAGDARNAGSIPGLGRSPGAGKGKPLQYSRLENSMDRGTWWATVHGAAKNQTVQLNMHGFPKPFPLGSQWYNGSSVFCKSPHFPISSINYTIIKMITTSSSQGNVAWIILHTIWILQHYLAVGTQWMKGGMIELLFPLQMSETARKTSLHSYSYLPLLYLFD